MASIAVAAATALGIAACGGNNDDNTANTASIQTLSNRADLVSGGSVLVEVKLPAGTTAAKLTVDVDGVDVSAAFLTRTDGRTVGLVSG